MKKKEPWNFCETPEEKCTMNYCDENGCQNRKRNYVQDNIPIPEIEKINTEVDVLDKIKDLLVFESNDDFYYLQILQRKKENPQLGSNSRVIKNYYINSIEYLDDKYDEIKKLCKVFNARAMLRLNKRSYQKIAFKTMVNMANSMSNQEYEFIKNSYTRACGNGHNDKNKKWILDIDEIIHNNYLNNMMSYINDCEPEGNKFIIKLPTKNGIHIITKPFNLQKFRNEYPEIEIHKDNPINLYIPNMK